MEIKLVTEVENVKPKIADVQYGTVVRLEGSIYMKMSKRTGMGILLNWTPGHCILTNLRYGTMRQVKGDALVKVLHTSRDAEMFEATDRATVGVHLK